MANMRALGASVSVLVLCWGLATLFSSSRLHPTLISPNEFIWSLKEFQELISCADFSTGAHCFRYHRSRLLMELRNVVEESSFHALTECFSRLLKEDRDSVIFLQLSTCLHESGVENLVQGLLPTYTSTSESGFFGLPRLGLGEKDTPLWIGCILILWVLLFVPLWFAYLGWEDDVVDNAALRYPRGPSSDVSSSKESESRPVVAKSLDEVYDLSNQVDLKKWRRKFELHRLQSTIPVNAESKYPVPVYSPGIEPSDAGTIVGTSCESSPKTATCVSPPSNHGQAHVETELKARTDVNIHDPSIPVPSVLHFPRKDHRGRLHHRVFLPGRGWLSIAELEKERLELLAQLQGLSWELKTSMMSPSSRDERDREREHRIRSHNTITTAPRAA